jgi:hypothetical protein
MQLAFFQGLAEYLTKSAIKEKLDLSDFFVGFSRRFVGFSPPNPFSDNVSILYNQRHGQTTLKWVGDVENGEEHPRLERPRPAVLP